MVRALHAAGHRGHPRRGLQPHRRGQPPGPHAVLQGHRQRRLLPAGGGRPEALHGLHRHRQLAERPAARTRCSCSWTRCATGSTEMHVDGFRFDLASTLAREFYDVDKLVHLLRTHPAGPGGVPGEAHRRAVGRRPRRLPGGQLPAAVDGVERPVPRHGPRLLARRTVHPGRVRLPARPARRTSTSTPAAGRWHRSTSSPPTTASRCATWCPTTRSTTRPTARATTTANPTTAPGTAASRAPPTIPSVLALRARQQRNFIASLLLSQGVPMLLHGDELGRTQQGNNNGYCQDSELTWINWDSVDQPLVRVHGRRQRPAAPEHPTLPAQPLLRRHGPCCAGEGERLPDIVWLDPDGEHHERRSTGTAASAAR